MIEVKNLRKEYKFLMQKPLVAVENTSFKVQRGESFALLGENGAGKSTTFKSLTKEITPTSGEILIEKQSLTENFNEIREIVGYCPQKNALFPNFTVKEHLEFFFDFKKLPQF